MGPKHAINPNHQKITRCITSSFGAPAFSLPLLISHTCKFGDRGVTLRHPDRLARA
jgi:hypothetical protein